MTDLPPLAPALLRVVDRDVLAGWRDAGAAPCAVYVTEPAANDFPRLPVGIVSISHAAGLPRLDAVLRATVQVLPARLRRAIAQWQERRFEDAVCRTLRELDDRTLRDLGLDRSEIWPAMLRNDPTRMPRGRASP
jgi:uncharacterized protein YjiS (DUF1127 family)